uniref:Uncharacterized protein n=1 Tax=Arundo donax TaxID=35708 RepID=A0A0A9DI65_ARUDO
MTGTPNAGAPWSRAPARASCPWACRPP